jgi:hypothetical protein
MPKLTRILAFLAVASICASAPAVAAQATPTRVIGGEGGAAQTDQCADGDYLVGIETASGKDLNQITALCQPYANGQINGDTYELGTWGQPPDEGGFSGLDNAATCPMNSVAVGISVQVSKVNLVHRFRLTCTSPGSTKTSSTKWSGTNGGEAAATGSADCGSGLAVGIAFQYGANIDALGLLCLAAAPADTTPPQTQPHRVLLESTNFPGMYLRHKNFQAVLTKLSSDLDIKDATFILEPALTHAGKAAVSFESTNFPGMFLRHKNFRLVLEKNDGSDQFAKDASFTMWPGPNGAFGFEASNFPLYFIRHKDFKLWVEKTDDSKQFHADSGFMVRSPSRPIKVDRPNDGNGDQPPTDTVPTAKAKTDTTLYASPGGAEIDYLTAGDPVTIVACNNTADDHWCHVSAPKDGYIWGDDLER